MTCFISDIKKPGASKPVNTEGGFTLIETIMFTTLVALLSLIGAGGIINFRAESALDNITQEMISEIRSARAKSMNGELLQEETTNLFNSEGLPQYGVAISGDSYKLIRKCIKTDLTICEDDPPLRSVNIGDAYTLSPTVTFYFERISGDTENQAIILSEKSGNRKRQITISDNSAITATKI